MSPAHRASTRTNRTCQRASSANEGTLKLCKNKRRVFPASKENTTMWKVRRLASFAKQTPIPRTETEPPNAFHVRPVVLPMKEVRNAPIVWRGNTKKPQLVAKRSVPVVRQAITRTLQTCKHANDAHLGMPNRRRDKHPALNAVAANSTMLQGLFIANHV